MLWQRAWNFSSLANSKPELRVKTFVFQGAAVALVSPGAAAWMGLLFPPLSTPTRTISSTAAAAIRLTAAVKMPVAVGRFLTFTPSFSIACFSFRSKDEGISGNRSFWSLLSNSFFFIWLPPFPAAWPEGWRGPGRDGSAPSPR